MVGFLLFKFILKENGYEFGSDGELDEIGKDEEVLGFKKDIEILNERIMKLKR